MNVGDAESAVATALLGAVIGVIAAEIDISKAHLVSLGSCGFYQY
jgi:hypothetical protein